MTMQQINTPTGPKFIAVPLGQTLMQGQVRIIQLILLVFGKTLTFPFLGRTLPGCNPAGRRPSSAGSEWSAGSASADGWWSNLLNSKFRSVGSNLILGDWPGFYASSEPLRQPASGLIITLIFSKITLMTTHMLKTTTIAMKTIRIGKLTTDSMTMALTEIKRKF